MNRQAGRCRRAQRMYGLLVRLYPAAHRRAFGDQMVQTFGDHYRDAVEVGGGSRLRFWLAVLADAGTSLRTEHASERSARRQSRRRRRAATVQRRRRGPRSRGIAGRRRRVRRLRYGPPVGRPVRVMVRTRRHQVVYRRRIALLAVLVGLIDAGFAAGAITGHSGLSVLLTGLLVAAWLGYAIRLDRRAPAGPRGDGPAPPGGAGVREPRRPLPISTAGAAARPRPDRDPAGPAAALI
jgi:hypothetical protein